MKTRSGSSKIAFSTWLSTSTPISGMPGSRTVTRANPATPRYLP